MKGWIGVALMIAGLMVMLTCGIHFLIIGIDSAITNTKQEHRLTIPIASNAPAVSMGMTNIYGTNTMTAPELAADHMVLAKDAIHRTIEETLVEAMKAGWRAGAAGISQAEMLQQFTNRVVRVLQ